MVKYKKDPVTVTFHYLVRHFPDGEGEVTQEKISYDDFQALSASLQSLNPMDLQDEAVKQRVRLKKAVPIEDVAQLNERMVFGVYRAAYWGHAYDNTHVGKVPADSINLRRFYFILYLSPDGRLYVGVQYLGRYGSYEGLKNTLLSFLPCQKNIVGHTFRQDSAMFEDVDPSEITVTVARKSEDIATPSSVSEEALVTFKKKGRDSDFGERVRSKLLPVAGTDAQKVKKAASEFVNESGLMDLSDKDIADCTVIGTINGQRKKVYMISQGLLATQFPISTSYDEDGIPVRGETEEKMKSLLKSKIIAVISDG